jgi:hypothetical protein
MTSKDVGMMSHAGKMSIRSIIPKIRLSVISPAEAKTRRNKGACITSRTRAILLPKKRLARTHTSSAESARVHDKSRL